MEMALWIIKKDFEGNDDYTCSKCGWGFIGEPENCLDARDFNYCPNCGSKITEIKKARRKNGT